MPAACKGLQLLRCEFADQISQAIEVRASVALSFLLSCVAVQASYQLLECYVEQDRLGVTHP